MRQEKDEDLVFWSQSEYIARHNSESYCQNCAELYQFTPRMGQDGHDRGAKVIASGFSGKYLEEIFYAIVIY